MRTNSADVEVVRVEPRYPPLRTTATESTMQTSLELAIAYLGSASLQEPVHMKFFAPSLRSLPLYYDIESFHGPHNLDIGMLSVHFH